MTDLKICSCCKKEKSLEDFYKRKQHTKYYIVPKCKKCAISFSKEKKEIRSKYSRDYARKQVEVYGKLPYLINNMIRRCESKKDKSYRFYGAKGIKVCDEWHKRKNFYDWAKNNGYKEGLEIDRIDSDGDYCPENCRFITRLVNLRNKKSIKLSMNHAKAIRCLFNNGFTQAEIAFFFNIDARQIHKVINNLTWRK